MQIIDAQVHIWEADRPDRPWAQGMRAPQRPTPLTAEDLLGEMAVAGVSHAVLVPPSWVGNCNDTVIEAARAYPDKFTAVGRFPVETHDIEALIGGWREQGMAGVRLTFISEAEKAFLSDPRSAVFWAAVERHDLPVMLYPYAYLHDIAQVAQRFPGARLIIDHMAANRAKDDEAFSTLPALLALARYPNVAVKASALPHYSTQAYPFPGLHEPIRRALDAFGRERVFWGTDLTRLPCTYRQAVTLFTEALPFLSDEDKDWVMGRGLRQWLALP